MEYNSTKEEYYITKADVLAETFYSDSDLGRVYGDQVDKNLAIMSHAVYRLIYGYYRGVNKQRHINFMKTKIANNTNGEQTFLKMAMVEMVRGSIESGMDLNAYVNDPKSIFPDPVYEELRNGFLLDAREKVVD